MNKLTEAETVESFIRTYEQYKEKGDFRTTVYEEILNLINRQKAEIKELRADINYLFENMPHMKAEIIKEFVNKHREMIMEFRDDDDQISLKVCEYDANTNNLMKEVIQQDD